MICLISLSPQHRTNHPDLGCLIRVWDFARKEGLSGNQPHDQPQFWRALVGSRKGSFHYLGVGGGLVGAPGIGCGVVKVVLLIAFFFPLRICFTSSRTCS
jgi:hypothetical protein